MCAIIGSFNKTKLKELHQLNAYRGELSYSLSTFRTFNNNTDLQVLMQDRCKMSEGLIDSIPSTEGDYFIGHTQAPTTDSLDIHPAVGVQGGMLWHNGIIKQSTIPKGSWDTSILLNKIQTYGWSILSQIDGTFACIMYSCKLFVFRNEISPLFIDKELNISSTKFENSEPLKPNTVFEIDLINRTLVEIASFNTVENPYFFYDEVNI